MVMKQEAVAKYGLYYATKMYSLLVLEMEGVRFANPKVKLTGLKAKKMIFSKKVRKVLTELTEIITTKEYPQFIKRYREIKEEFYNSPITDIAKISSCKFVTEKNTWTIDSSGLPLQVRAGFTFNNIIKELNHEKYTVPIASGEKIKFVNLLESETQPYRVIGWPNVDSYSNFLKDIGYENLVDIDTLFEENIEKSIEPLALLRKIDITEVLKEETDTDHVKKFILNNLYEKNRTLNSIIRYYNKEIQYKKFINDGGDPYLGLTPEKKKEEERKKEDKLNKLKKAIIEFSIPNELFHENSLFVVDVDIEKTTAYTNAIVKQINEFKELDLDNIINNLENSTGKFLVPWCLPKITRNIGKDQKDIKPKREKTIEEKNLIQEIENQKKLAKEEKIKNQKTQVIIKPSSIFDM
jgi:5-formyltetrahydrofolate cyclo-ligase